MRVGRGSLHASSGGEEVFSDDIESVQRNVVGVDDIDATDRRNVAENMLSLEADRRKRDVNDSPLILSLLIETVAMALIDNWVAGSG